MKIDELTIGEAKQLCSIFGPKNQQDPGLNNMVGNKVIIRTCSAGVHFGELFEKSGEEVILKNARRLWRWKTVNGGISLSEIANHGVDKTESRISEAIKLIWLKAIEIIPCENSAIKSIEDQDVYKA